MTRTRTTKTDYYYHHVCMDDISMVLLWNPFVVVPVVMFVITTTTLMVLVALQRVVVLFFVDVVENSKETYYGTLLSLPCSIMVRSRIFVSLLYSLDSYNNDTYSPKHNKCDDAASIVATVAVVCLRCTLHGKWRKMEITVPSFMALREIFQLDD